MNFSIESYISSEEAEQVKQFKYKGGSDSLTYKYIWSPFSEFIIQKMVSRRIAPNLITVVGFLFLLASHILTIHAIDYDISNETILPNWINYMNAVFMFIYYTSDNLDGKQARRTSSSSPLGMLFDHGLDSICSWLIGINIGITVLIKSEIDFMMSIWFISLVPFFIGTWAQYHVGCLRFGYVNGVDEGLILVVVVYLISGILGNAFWGEELILGFKRGEALVFACAMSSVIQNLQFVFQVFSLGREKVKSISDLLCVVILSLTVFSVCYLRDGTLEGEVFLYCLYAICISWSAITLRTQLSHISQKKLTVLHLNFLLVNTALLGFVLLAWFTKQEVIDFGLVCVALFIISLSLYLQQAVSICIHMSNILGIRIFRLQEEKNVDFVEMVNN